MKYFLIVFMVIFGFAQGQESDSIDENNIYFSIDEPIKYKAIFNLFDQQDYAQEVEDSCDMRGRACQTYFYWKGYGFWLLEGNINEGSLIKLLKTTHVSSGIFMFIDEDSNLIRVQAMFYYD